jgi:DMSO/TMAO reductase YedYZ molybdopterin-dependent catalytic subunit
VDRRSPHRLLNRAGVRSTVTDVVFRGADCGTVDRHAEPIHFERSLPLDIARGDGLVAYAMNGEPLPLQHGYPVRLVVPGWYGVASVKWLTHIELVDHAFDGYFQANKYWYEADGTPRKPVTLQRVRALITYPQDGDTIHAGEILIRGVAWSGAAPIARVDISVNHGSWQKARLLSHPHRHGWQWWELLTHFDTPGAVAIRARGTDLAGQTQPEFPVRNRHGYGNNAMQTVRAAVC